MRAGLATATILVLGAGLGLGACATGSTPSFADSGPAAPAATPSEASAALAPGPILAASGNTVLPIYDLNGGLVRPLVSGLPAVGARANLGPASLGLTTQPGLTGLTSPSVLLQVDLGGSVLVSPRPATSGPLAPPDLLGVGSPLLGVTGPLLPGHH